MADPQSKRAVDAPTLDEALRRTARAHPDIIAVRTLDDRVSLTWSALLRRVEAAARGLARLGVGRGETVAIMMGNRPEFHIADLAAVTLGATPFSVYLTSPAEQVRWLLADAAPRVAFVEQASLPVMLEASKDLPGSMRIVVVGGAAIDGAVTLDELERSAPDLDLAVAARGIGAEDIATLIYTSGTTGSPKGVQLTHRNILCAANGLEQIIRFRPGFRMVSWLPAAHVAERMAAHYLPMVFAGTVTCCPNPREVLSVLPQVRPTWFFAVPRVWEKLKAGLEAKLAAGPDGPRQQIEAAIQCVRMRQRGEAVSAALEEQVAQADKAVFAPIRAMLGLDQTELVSVGSAPTPMDVLEFFHALGLELADTWGLSETCGAGTVNRTGKTRLGTVGTPHPGMELKLAHDGEVLLRGDYVMRGYRNAPEKTAEVIDADGWFHTGDVGVLDADGFLKIIDRKKEIIINAAGKNMSPANIEAAIKSSSLLIGQAICIGEAKPYNTALIVLDADYAPQWAKRSGIEAASLEELSTNAEVSRAIDSALQKANQHLSRVEQIKRFRIVSGDWLPGGDELTPTMKLKRKAIASKYQPLIDEMYAP
ncbi:long-chain fatty acid--CoA ligase [Ideonella sp. B508-1]|uniref:AMP-dependent synthetase/ligase n=1 Tax=Ideonella sp. B508-1 TaxID=137716 RepID=UPI0003B311A2|nr:long-chain fatty acid--CoA ligase [Ideonella sp. B508-1]